MASPSKSDKQQKQQSSNRQAEQQQRLTQAEAVASRRKLSKKQREQQQQRRVFIALGAALGVIVLVLLVGVLYDQVWLPSRAVAQVDDTTLTRGEYWQEQRLQAAQQMAQIFALMESNPEFGSQFAGQAATLNQQLAAVESQPENDQVLTAWQDYQLLQQGAADLDIQVSASEIDQTIASDLGVLLPDPTAALTQTEALTQTDSPTEEAAATPEPANTLTDDTLTDTESLEDPPALPTIPPTSTPAPTPEADVAAEQVPQIIDTLYQRYLDEVNLLGGQPYLSEQDFREALERQYRQELLTEKVRQALVPEEEFESSDEPDRVRARHVLLSPDLPEDEEVSEEERAQAIEELEPEAQDVVEELREGADFADVATERSDDPGSAAEGGDVGFFDREGVTDSGGTFVPEFVEAAFALEGEEISDPVRSQFGWHIIQVTEREAADPEQQLATARSEAFETWLETLRAESDTFRISESPTPVPQLPEGALPTPQPTFLPGPPTPVQPPVLPEESLPELEPAPPAPEEAPDTP